MTKVYVEAVWHGRYTTQQKWWQCWDSLGLAYSFAHEHVDLRVSLACWFIAASFLVQDDV